MRFRAWIKRQRCRLRKHVTATVSATMSFGTVNSGPAGTVATLTVTATQGGSPVPDGTQVSVPITAPDGSTPGESPLTGVASGGSVGLSWTADAETGVYSFGPPTIAGEVVAGVTAAFTRSSGF